MPKRHSKNLRICFRGVQLSFVGISDSRTTPGKGDFTHHPVEGASFTSAGKETQIFPFGKHQGAASEPGTAVAAVSPLGPARAEPGPLGLIKRRRTEKFWLQVYFFIMFQSPRPCAPGA